MKDESKATEMLRVALVGASGYSGAELLRLLLEHPCCDTITLFSSTLQSAYKKSLEHGQHFLNYADICPAFYGLGLKIYGLPSDNIEEWEIFYRSFDVVFLATPHAVSVQIMQRYMKLLNKGLAKIIDLSGALRLQPEIYYQWYCEETLRSEELQLCQYGLSELFRSELLEARIVASPGCYATAAILALAPLAKQGLLSRVRIDAKSGVSGAGKKTTDSTHFPQTNESLSLYKLHRHQHTPEIEMALSHCAGRAVEPITFTTHLLPITRGLMATCYVESDSNETDLFNIYWAFYSGAPFVQIRPAKNIPQIQDVSFSNRCDIGLHCNPRNNELVVVAVIDNLLKGAAGQAVQNMNLMFGLEEACGLPRVGALP